MGKEPRGERFARKAGIGAGGGFGEGIPWIDKKDLNGKEVILVDFQFALNTFRQPDQSHPNGYERAIVLFELDGEQGQCSFSGNVVVDALKNRQGTKDQDLPAPVVFIKKMTKDKKRTFWTME